MTLRNGLFFVKYTKYDCIFQQLLINRVIFLSAIEDRIKQDSEPAVLRAR